VCVCCAGRRGVRALFSYAALFRSVGRSRPAAEGDPLRAMQAAASGERAPGSAGDSASRLGEDFAHLWEPEEEVREVRDLQRDLPDRKSTRLNSSHVKISYAVFCLK